MTRCECSGHQRHDPNPDCPQHGLDAAQPHPAWVAAMDSWDADFNDHAAMMLEDDHGGS